MDELLNEDFLTSMSDDENQRSTPELGSLCVKKEIIAGLQNKFEDALAKFKDKENILIKKDLF
jgi:hypothetical protein